MLRGLYTSYTGMRVQQDRLDVISNNLANVNTNGYKKDGVIIQSFEDVFASKIKDPDTAFDKKIGKMSHGAKLERTYVNYEQGSFKETNDPYNVAIEGDGMFAIAKQDADGNVTTHYTRDGSFTTNQDSYLVTQDGYYVMGNNGPIQMNRNQVIDKSGRIYDNNELVDNIKLVDFEDYDMVKKIGGGNFANKEEENLIAFSGSLIQGFVESSNVNTVNEMVNMINVNRTFESNQKVLQTYDATLDKAVNNIGRV